MEQPKTQLVEMRQQIPQINMKNLNKIKTAVFFSFLLITYGGGTLTLINFLWIIVGLITSFIDLLSYDCNLIDSIKGISILIFTLLSLYYIFNRNKYLVLISIIIQYSYLYYISNLKYFELWYFTIPTTIYLILSLILVYFLFFNKEFKDKTAK